MQNKNEIWKDIPNYEGLYQVSNLGIVKSMKRTITRKNGKVYTQKEHIMKTYKSKRGYLYVVLSKQNCKNKIRNIHQLVAECFLDWHNYKYTINDLNKVFSKSNLEVNHINGIKTDNKANNLEWCTRSYNLKEAFRLGLNHSPSKGKYGKESLNSKEVIQFATNGEEIKKWESITQAQQELSLYNITKCCKGDLKTCGGFIWRYANE